MCAYFFSLSHAVLIGLFVGADAQNFWGKHTGHCQPPRGEADQRFVLLKTNCLITEI